MESVLVKNSLESKLGTHCALPFTAHHTVKPGDPQLSAGGTKESEQLGGGLKGRVCC
jgi:hypothetical protein